MIILWWYNDTIDIGLHTILYNCYYHTSLTRKFTILYCWYRIKSYLECQNSTSYCCNCISISQISNWPASIQLGQGGATGWQNSQRAPSTESGASHWPQQGPTHTGSNLLWRGNLQVLCEKGQWSIHLENNQHRPPRWTTQNIFL